MHTLTHSLSLSLSLSLSYERTRKRAHTLTHSHTNKPHAPRNTLTSEVMQKYTVFINTLRSKARMLFTYAPQQNVGDIQAKDFTSDALY